VKEADEWYVREVFKLLFIMKQEDFKKDNFVSKDYIIEKLERIITGIGIGIHPTLRWCVEKAMKKWREENGRI
jgi:hypothetical protein